MKARSTLPAFIASNTLPAASKGTSSIGTPARRASSRERSTETPLGAPSAPFCASTALPRLIAARSLPVGASSLRTSGGAARCAKAANAPVITNSNEQASLETKFDMTFLPADQRPVLLDCRRPRTAASIRRRRHGRFLLRTRDCLGDESRGLHFLDEPGEEACGIRPPLRQAHRLRNLHEAAIEEPHLGVGGQEPDHRLFDTGDRFELVAQECLEGMLSAHQRCMLERAREEKIVGGTLADSDPHTGAIDFVVAGEA